ncbi:hypothetical protein OsI_15392 [Oryza sativa Indica Group]|uniref:Uncharacterized protein n=2 Tax=Oryza sativa TaxID=4530 RepID=A3ASI5_ORYSJ|nr:hypothetical protein OsI_15392 [Oryza sativa Indica Group]EAZ30274.1 hypothetical protein OsJ_14322 [Oryza sativa Japonica Group]
MASARAGSTAGGRCPDPALAAGGVPRGAEVSGGGLEEERRRQAKGSWRWRQAEGSPAGRSPSPRQIWPAESIFERCGMNVVDPNLLCVGGVLADVGGWTARLDASA